MFALMLSAALAASPADEVRAAAADIETQPLELRPGTRYLTLYAIPPDARRETLQVAGYTLNALSRTRVISQPVQISPTLVRFHISQFAPRKDEFVAWQAAWEKLAESDPYFHLRTEVLAKDRGTRSAEQVGGFQNLSRLNPRSSILTVTLDGGWTDLTAAARLRASSQSIGAILRADYFVAAATRTPAYYDFAGVPATENEFLKSLGVDRETIDRLRANAGANLLISGVTNKPRRVVWSQGPLGGVYATLDVETVDAARDPIRRPISVEERGSSNEDRVGANIASSKTRSPLLDPHPSSRSSIPAPRPSFSFKFDVSEWFAVAPNGLWRTALFDAAGRRQNTVPDRVAKDTSDPLGDGIVVPLVSCIRCHREAGLRPFADDQTKLLAGRVDLLSNDPNIVQRAAEFYDEPRLQRQMQFDRETYTAAVDRATGLAPAQLADALASVVRHFAYQPIAIDQAAREIGIDSETFRSVLAATHDPVILILLENRAVLRGQWESSFAEAATAARSLTAEAQRRGESMSRAEAQSSLSNQPGESIIQKSSRNSSANSAPLREQK
jgi:hypothetical protein